jgi:hypothetical protein
VASPSGAVTLRSSENSAAASYTHETRAFSPASGVRYRITRLSKYRVGALTSGLTNQDPTATGNCSSGRTPVASRGAVLSAVSQRQVSNSGGVAHSSNTASPRNSWRACAPICSRDNPSAVTARPMPSRVPAKEPRTVFESGASRQTGPTLRPLAFR